MSVVWRKLAVVLAYTRLTTNQVLGAEIEADPFTVKASAADMSEQQDILNRGG